MPNECPYCKSKALLKNTKDLGTVIKTNWECTKCHKVYMTVRKKECW